MTDAALATRKGVAETPESAVSWAAIFAGAVVASAFSLALLILGAGIGLVSVSPWSSNAASATTFGVLAAAWFIATQLFAAGIGGYIAGRLRSRWVLIHGDEAFFRDTAHGLLVWALGAVVSAGLLAVTAAGGATLGAAHPMQAGNPAAYFVDLLFRADHPTGDVGAARAEASRILAMDAASRQAPADDRTYLTQLVAAHTGLGQADAEKRVSEVADRAKAAADAARKTGVYVGLWAFISLLVGAFSASYMATVGGRARDDLPMTG